MVTAKKSAVEKSDIVVAKVPAVKKKTVAKPKRTESNSAKQVLSDEQRARYVEVAAFYIAERRGFAAGNPTDDWLAAEAEVNRLVDSGHFPA